MSLPKIPALDFTNITRLKDRYFTSICLADPYAGEQFQWIQCGTISIHKGTGKFNNYRVDCRLDGATDFEHSSVYAFCLDTVGLEWEFLHDGMTYYKGWVRADESEGFKIPNPDYSPLKGSTNCKECTDRRHVIVKEGFYVPKPNVDLWNQVRGLMVEIRTGPLYPKIDV